MASEIITVLLVLWCLNFIAGMIQRTYSIGKAFGRFYRTYLHKHLKNLFFQLTSLLSKKRGDSHPESTRQAREARQAT